jgi:hypothetical protein
MTDAPLAICQHCGGAVHRVPQAAGVIFKGSGFYKTDARKDTGFRKDPLITADTGALCAESQAVIDHAEPHNGNIFKRR